MKLITLLDFFSKYFFFVPPLYYKVAIYKYKEKRGKKHRALSQKKMLLCCIIRVKCYTLYIFIYNFNKFKTSVYNVAKSILYGFLANQPNCCCFFLFYFN